MSSNSQKYNKVIIKLIVCFLYQVRIWLYIKSYLFVLKTKKQQQKMQPSWTLKKIMNYFSEITELLNSLQNIF